MPVLAPFNLKKWIDEHRDLLKPPVGNQCIYKDAENFIVMVVGGPNARKDYHFNESEELYYQVEGNIVLKIIDEGVPKSIPINEGDMFLLPPKTPCSIRPNVKGNEPPPCAKATRKFGKAANTPPKIMEQMARLVSAGMPTSQGNQYFCICSSPIISQGCTNKAQFNFSAAS